MSVKEDKDNINIEKGSVNCNFCRCGKKSFTKKLKQRLIKMVMLYLIK